MSANEQESDLEENPPNAEEAQLMEVLEDPDAIDVDFNHGRIAKIENLEILTRVETLCLR